jgi:RecA/RadA recombinase
MFDFTYKNKLKFVTVTDINVTGDAERLAQTIAQWDEDSDPTWSNFPVPTFNSEATGPDYVVTYDASELDGLDAKAVWSCRVDLGALLDWAHPWEDATITAAERIYHEHRTADTRWVLPHIEADAARFLRGCVADECAMTPKDADKLMGYFLDALRDEAEEGEDTDQMAALLSEAMEDAKPTSTGLPQLDAVLGGGLHHGLAVVAGNPSSGKTALAVQAALFAANKRGGKVVYCMADQGGKKSALLRMISCAAAIVGVQGCELGRAGAWDAREVYQGRQAFDRVTKGRIELTDQPDVSELISWLDFLSRTKGHVGFCVVDFAQAASWDGRALAFDTEAASLAVRELRAWAHSHNAVILLLSAFTKSASENHARGAAPSMTDVLGSSELSYSAEHVLALASPNDGSGTVTVRDLKHRHAGNAAQADRACTLHLDAEHGLFS